MKKSSKSKFLTDSSPDEATTDEIQINSDYSEGNILHLGDKLEADFNKGILHRKTTIVK